MSGYGTPAQRRCCPALTLGLLGAGWYARMVRSAMVDVLDRDYVRTARAKGLTAPRVVLRHALPNALLPIVAMIGIDVGPVHGRRRGGGGRPTAGPASASSRSRPSSRSTCPVIMGVTLVSALAVVLGNLLADLAAPLLDPRIRAR